MLIDALDIIVTLITAVVFSMAMVAGALVAACAVSIGGCSIWYRRRKTRLLQGKKKNDAPGDAPDPE